MGIAQDAMKSHDNARFQTTVAPKVQRQASPEVAARLAAAQQRLAAARAQLQQQEMAQLQQYQTPGAAPLTLATPASTSRYTPSGAYAQPASPSTVWQAPSDPIDPSADVPISLAGLSTDDIADVTLGAASLGFPLEEVQDIIIESYEQQITDATQSEGPSASAHKAAAYLDPTYPLGGASAGRQGGSMRPEEKIYVGTEDVQVLGAGYARGLDVLGGMPAPLGAKFGTLRKSAQKGSAAATIAASRLTPRAGFVVKTAPKGGKFTSLVLNKPAKHDHKTSIKNARTAGARAVSVGNKVQAQLKKSAAAIKKVAVRGDLVGASAAVKRGVVRHLLTTAQIQKAAKAAVDLGNKTLKAADSHEKKIKLLNQKIAAGAAAARQKLKMGSAGKSKTTITGCSAEDASDLLGACVDVLGACVPDPTDPGWCTDGTVDPNHAGGAGAGPAGDAGPVDSGGATVAGPPDYGLGPAPTPDSVAPSVENGDYVADPFPGGQGDFVPYSSVPLDPSFAMGNTQDLPVGAVIYDGSVAPPFEGLGSYSFFYGDAGGAPPKGGQHSGEIWHNDGWWSFLHDAYSGPAGSGDQRLNHEDDNSPTAMQQRANNSFKFNWGPMIGNPNNTLRGLRYDVGGNQWFWYYDQAPAWAQAPIKQALLNQALLDYQSNLAAAAADFAAQAAADQLAADQQKEMLREQAVEDSKQQHQIEQEQAQANSEAQIQQLANASQAQQQQTQDDSYATRTQAEAQAQATLDQSSALTQAQIDQMAEAQAEQADLAAAQVAQQAQAPGGDDGDGSDAGDGDAGDDGDGSDAGDADDGVVAPYDESAKEDLDSEVLGGSGSKRLRNRVGDDEGGDDDVTIGDQDVDGDEWEQGEGGEDALARGEGEDISGFGMKNRRMRRE